MGLCTTPANTLLVAEKGQIQEMQWNGQPVRVLGGTTYVFREKRYSSVACNAEYVAAGAYFNTGYLAGNVSVFQYTTGICLRRFARDISITSMHFLADGSLILAAQSDPNVIFVHSSRDGHLIKTLSADMNGSHCWRTLALTGAGGVVVCDEHASALAGLSLHDGSPLAGARLPKDLKSPVLAIAIHGNRLFVADEGRLQVFE